MINILTTTPGVDEAAQIDSLALANEIAEKASAEATTSSMSIWDLCFGGGAFSVVLMCLLFALFFVMVFIFVDRFIAIRKATTIDSNFMNRIRDFISEGNIEAAIDLAGICQKVTVVEFMDSLKADKVLQDKARSLPNVEILTSTQTTKVEGNGEKLTALRLKNRQTDEEHTLELDGVFVQIGLSANSQPFTELEKTRIGEIVIDAHCRTNISGVYAAGDVSSVPYKQIIIAMGEGAKAALTAFDDRTRGVI